MQWKKGMSVTGRRDELARPNRAELPDWETMYREGTPPWETGYPASELMRVVQDGCVPRGSLLELGCGTGADTVYLARQGFEVTAVDSSPTALDRARTRAGLCGVSVRFVLDDAFRFARTSGAFNVIYDAGFYHFIRQLDLDRFLDLLWRITQPGSYYLTLAGATGEQAEGGPPQVSEEQIRCELGRLFEFLHLRPFRFESPRRPEGYLGWSCLLRRPQPVEIKRTS
jgi:SAM-dependent methyltransferase